MFLSDPQALFSRKKTEELFRGGGEGRGVGSRTLIISNNAQKATGCGFILCGIKCRGDLPETHRLKGKQSSIELKSRNQSSTKHLNLEKGLIILKKSLTESLLEIKKFNLPDGTHNTEGSAPHETHVDENILNTPLKYRLPIWKAGQVT